MARYSAQHKALTRARLLETARQEFRAHGFEAVSIDRLMRAAGLTRGGFYAHFESKEALVREVLRIEPGLLRALRETDGDPAARQTTARLVADYLDPAKREQLVQCPLVAHPLDAHRGGQERQALYASQITQLIERLRVVLGDAPDPDREATLIAVLTVGSAILGTAMSDPDVADRIETVCNDEISRRLLGHESGKPS